MSKCDERDYLVVVFLKLCYRSKRDFCKIDFYKSMILNEQMFAELIFANITPNQSFTEFTNSGLWLYHNKELYGVIELDSGIRLGYCKGCVCDLLQILNLWI